jgi:predicted anti-sigma-YlaC factor YlaD
VTCSDIRNITVPYLELDLEGDRVHQVTVHLETCIGCRSEMESVRQVLVGLKGRVVPDPGQRFWSEFPAQVRVRLLQARTTASRSDHMPMRRRSGLWAPWWSLAVAASVMILVGAWLLVGVQLFGTPGKDVTKGGSAPTNEAINNGSRSSDLGDVAEMDWDKTWDEDDPDMVLVDIAARLDPLTVDRLFKDI